MATVASTKVCLAWFQIAQSGPFPPRVGGAWNNDTTASPDDLVGGVPFNVGGCLDEPLYITAYGTGDAGIVLNLGEGGFVGSIPNTYYPGWPNAGYAPDRLDPTSGQGSADITAYNVSFPTVPGSARSLTGWTFGRYYIEYQVFYDIFSQQTGVGIMRKGAQLAYINAGGYSSTDPNGGAMITGGNIGTTPEYQTTLAALNVPNLKTSPFLGAPSTSTIGLAIAIIPQALFVPQPFLGVPLPHLICCPEHKELARAMAPGNAGNAARQRSNQS